MECILVPLVTLSYPLFLPFPGQSYVSWLYFESPLNADSSTRGQALSSSTVAPQHWGPSALMRQPSTTSIPVCPLVDSRPLLPSLGGTSQGHLEQRNPSPDMSQAASIPSDSSLGCILQHWAKFDPQILTNKCLIFPCNVAWPAYKLPDQEVWPQNGTLNHNTILQLDLLLWFL
jgi:hypothetical protein